MPLEFQNMPSMHRSLLAALLLPGIAIAQTTPTLQTRPAAKPAAASSAHAGTTGLPTKDPVNPFLFQMCGYDPTITWKVNEIHPSEVPGLAEVLVVITNPQGSTPNRLLGSADG